MKREDAAKLRDDIEEKLVALTEFVDSLCIAADTRGDEHEQEDLLRAVALLEVAEYLLHTAVNSHEESS